MNYKCGDKFIVEIGDILPLYGSQLLYVVKGFNTIVFDDFGLNKLDRLEDATAKAYEKGSRDQHAKNAATITNLLIEKKQMYDRGVKDGAELAAMHGSDASGQQLEETYFDGMEAGAQKAWEAARKIFCLYPVTDMIELFGREAVDEISLFEDYEPEEVLKMLNSYEAEDSAR